MNRTILQKALTSLVHPLTILAILTLLINDHVLRHTNPSWWTGKIGDAAWLFFFPFVLAIPLALFFRTDHPQNNQRIGMITFGLVALVFVLGKTLPVFTGWIETAMQGLFDAPFRIITDPSDLLTLVALAPAWYVWQSKGQGKGAGRVGWAALSLAALLTVANSAMPDYGIVCLSHQNDQLFASSNYFTYSSEDGGVTWNQAGSALQAEGNCFPDKKSETLTAADSSRTIRYTAGESIEVSSDGVTWETVVAFTSTNEAAQALYEKNHPLGAYTVHGPVAAVVDPRSGNAIFAMGHSGVLVLRPNNEVLRVNVGDYRQQEGPTGFASISRLLSGEFFLAITAGLLTIASLSLSISRPLWKKILTLLCWAGWLVVLVALPPAISNQAYASGLSAIAVSFIAISAFVLALFAAIQIWRHNPRHLGIAALAGLSAVLLFLVPFLLWAINAIPRYWIALIFGIILVAAITVPAYTRMKNNTALPE